MDKPKIVVVTPTYNERDNLPVLVERIFSLGIDKLSIIVVDDNSPDGTGQLAEGLAQKYPIKVIHRSEKRGLGTAYIEAFKFILKSQNPADYIMQIDADLSHDPAVIPMMIKKAGECDLVLGSRYIRGGGVENWNFTRRLISRFGNSYARFILGMPIYDMTGGFKCYRREVLEKINFDSLSSIGYNFQIETTYRVYRLGYKVREIPIIFKERKTGSSKFNLGIILESFFKVLILRFRGH
mgnify:FL=1